MTSKQKRRRCFKFACHLSLVTWLCFPAYAAEDKSMSEELIERRERVELMSFFMKDPKDAKMPNAAMAIQLYNQAVEHFKKNEYELSEEALLNSLKYNDENAFAYELLGDIEYLTQRLSDARSHYELAYNLDPRPSIMEKLKKLRQESRVEKKLSTYNEQHFIIKYHKQEIKDNGFELRELLKDTYRDLSKDFAYYFKHQVVVLLYDHEEFMQITGTPHWVAGLYDGKVRLPVNRAGFSEEDLKALTAHEVTHAFIAAMSEGMAPPWINEGLAEYEERKVKSDPLVVFNSAIKTKALLPLVQLTSQDGVMSLKDPLIIALFYEQSYHLTNYMVKRYGMFRVKQLLQEFAKGVDSDQAMRNVLRIGVPRLEKEWKESFQKSS